MKNTALALLGVQAFLGGTLTYPVWGPDAWRGIPSPLRAEMASIGLCTIVTAAVAGCAIIHYHARRWPR